VRETGRLALAGVHEIAFDEPRDMRFLQRERLPHHSNGMRFEAFDRGGSLLESGVYYSVGGGAIVDEAAIARNAPPEGAWDIPYNYHCAAELLEISEREGMSIADIALANERAQYSEEEITGRLAALSDAMSRCIDRGIGQEGILPGGLKVKRRAPGLYKLLRRSCAIISASPPIPTRKACAPFCLPRRRSAPCSRKMRRFRARKSAARGRSESPARWLRRA
jgi:L-serine dehydratase